MTAAPLHPPEPMSVPRHVAIIMDGNGRWATQRGLPRLDGHRAGSDTVRRIMEVCSDLGVRYLTLYAFSTENWKRPKTEITGLMGLLRVFLKTHVADLLKNDVRLNVIGQVQRLPLPVRKVLENVIAQTCDNQKLTLTLALSYGSRDEIVTTARRLAAEVQSGKLTPADITEERFTANLFTAGTPDPELIIRTSGEMRLSNFLLWQASYAEFYATETLWPDFGKEEFCKAIEAYNLRNRRFGGVTHV